MSLCNIKVNIFDLATYTKDLKNSIVLIHNSDKIEQLLYSMTSTFSPDQFFLFHNLLGF